MSKKIFYMLIFVGMNLSSLKAQRALSLEDIIDRAKGESPSAKQEETRKENRYWQYRVFRTNYNPQLRLDGSPGYQKAVVEVLQPDGAVEYPTVEQTNNYLNLGLLQPIPLTGGTISANSNLNYFNNFATDNGQLWRGDVMNLRLDQPFFAFNPLRWDKKTEPLRFEESKREFVEQIEFISQQAVERFFDVMQAQVSLQIALFNLGNNDTIFQIEQARYKIATTSLDKLLQVELQLLRSQQDVAQAALDMETSSLVLRTYIGLRDEESIQLLLPELIPKFSVSVDEALQYARANRAAYIAFERRRIEADREIAVARGERFSTKLSATYGLNNTGPMLGDIYVKPEELQHFSLAISVPVLDWGRNKARMRTAIANKKLNDYVIAQDEVKFDQEIRTQVRKFQMLRLQIDITKKADGIATERYNVAQSRYLIGKIDITNLNIALTEKDNAKQSYLEALKSFWMAYYNLRRLTLYDFAEKKLLYRSEQQ